jgi:phosphatidylinositol phospholipase C delta
MIFLYRFKVEDDAPRLVSINRDPFAAWACVRLDRLQTGYRFIHLFDANGNPTEGRLLVRIIKSLHDPPVESPRCAFKAK